MKILHSALACVLCAPSLLAGTNEALRVGAYNIRFASGDRGGANDWNLRKGDVSTLIRRLDMDVFGLQEVEPEQVRYLCESLPEYEIIGDHRNSDRISGEASPVVYRKRRFAVVRCGTFWLSEKPDEAGSRGWGAFNPRVCTWAHLRDKLSGIEFCFLNAHPDSKNECARNNGMGLVLCKIRELVANGIPVVFVGDHNCRETATAALLVAKHLQNAMLVSETTPMGPWRTFNGWRWRDEEVSAEEMLKITADVRNGDRELYDRCGGSRIDYIYVSPEVRVVRYETIAASRRNARRYPSDHFPVVATLIFTDR